MKKSKKGRARASKPKARSRKRPAAQPRQRAVPAASAADLYSGGFDFTSPAAPEIRTDALNRARAQLQMGKPDQALAFAREALSENPQDPAALNVAGVAAFQTGQQDEGLDLLRTAVAFMPNDAEVQTNLGNMLAALGKPEEAEDAYKAAMSADLNYAEAAFNLGVLMEAEERAQDALDAYERTLEIALEHIGAGQGRGNALKALKRLDEAKAAFEEVLTRNPALPEARTNLSAVLQELGDFEGAAREARRAFEADPDLLEAEYNHAIACQELGRYEEAIEGYRHILAEVPEHAASALNIGYGLQQLGKLDEAADAFEKAIKIDPHFAKAHVNLADLRLQQKNPQGALEACERYLGAHPGQTDLLAFKAIALGDLGKTDQAQSLIDFDRFVRTVHITPPEEFGDLASFNEALSAHVLDHPTLTFSPQSHATREGRHSGELLSEPKGPIAGLEAEILKAAQVYRDSLTEDDHPFVARKPSSWTLSVWGVVMQAAGHQIPHIHPAAWLSGVYYPKLPDIVGSDDTGKAGWIEFGRPPSHFHNAVEPETLSVRPECGMMVLFPSYFYHHTVPFEAAGTRISIAFDLMPT